MQKFLSNLKDTVSSICGFLFALGGAGVGLSTQIPLPKGVVVASYSAMAVSGAVVGFLTGKAPNGSTKTDAQVQAQNPPTGLSSPEYINKLEDVTSKIQSKQP
jgi:hypothetical protein